MAHKVVLQTEYSPSDVAVFADAIAATDALTQPSNLYFDYGVNYTGYNEYAFVRLWVASNATAILHEESPQISAAFTDPVVNVYYCRIQKVRNNPWSTAIVQGPITTGTILSAAVDGLGYILDQTIDIDYDGTPIPVIPPDERYFVKSLTDYAVEINIACNEASTYDNYHFASKDYNIVLSWKSLRTNETFAMSVGGLEKNVVSITEHIDIPPPVDVSLPTKEIGNVAKALKVPPAGHYPNKNDVPTDFSDLIDCRSLNTVTLRQLVNYMNTESPGHTEQDVFTEITCTFYEAGTTNVVEEKTVDYTSLYGDPDVEIDEGIPYNDPTTDPDIDDDNTYTDHIDLTVPTLTATGVFNRCYTLDGNGVNDLCDYLYNANDSVFEEIIDGVLTRGNPIESLIDLRLYPFDVRQFTGGGTSQAIKFGRTVTSVIGVKLPHNANAVISLGHADIPRYANNFIDYEMEVHLYIPFCGTIDLPANRVVNHRVSVKLIVDYITGACTAVVYCDQIPIAYKQGVIGISIPMTATDSAE